MLNFLKARSRCFVYLPLRVEPRELLSLTSATGFELQAIAHVLWITADGESRDIFVSPGERFRIGTRRRVLLSADHAVSVIVSGEANRASRVDIIRANGEHERAYPPSPASRQAEPYIWNTEPSARRVRRSGIVACSNAP